MSQSIEYLKRIISDNRMLLWFIVISLGYIMIVGQAWNRWNLEHKHTVIRDFVHSGAVHKDGEVMAGRLSTTGALLVSKCAAETGRFIVICNEKNQFDRYDNINFLSGDDMGSPFFITLDSALRGKTARYTDSARINLTVNLIAFMIMASILYSYFGILAGLIFYLFSLPTVMNFMTFQHVTHPGVAVLVILPCLVLISYFQKQKLNLKIGIYFILSLLLFAIGTLWRKSIGQMGFALFVLVGFWLFTVNKKSIMKSLGLIVSAVFVYIALNVDKIINAIAAIKYNLTQAIYTGHGFSHTLVIGLGEVKNPFNLSYDDGVALSIAKKIDPTVSLVTSQYYEVLREYYFNLLQNHPWEILKIYFTKLYLTMVHKTEFAVMNLPYRLIAIGLVIILLFSFYRNSTQKKENHLYFHYTLLSLIMMLFFIAQSVVGWMYDLIFLPFWIFFAIVVSITISKYYKVTINRNT